MNHLTFEQIEITASLGLSAEMFGTVVHSFFIIVVCQRFIYHQLPGMFLGQSEEEALKHLDFLKTFLAVHNSLPSYTATPRRFMELLKNYQHIFNTKRDGVQQRQTHLQVIMKNFSNLIKVEFKKIR